MTSQNVTHKICIQRWPSKSHCHILYWLPDDKTDTWLSAEHFTALDSCISLLSIQVVKSMYCDPQFFNIVLSSFWHIIITSKRAFLSKKGCSKIYYLKKRNNWTIIFKDFAISKVADAGGELNWPLILYHTKIQPISVSSLTCVSHRGGKNSDNQNWFTFTRGIRNYFSMHGGQEQNSEWSIFSHTLGKLIPKFDVAPFLQGILRPSGLGSQRLVRLGCGALSTTTTQSLLRASSNNLAQLLIKLWLLQFLLEK